MKRTLLTLVAMVTLTATPLLAQENGSYRGGAWGGLGFGYAVLGCFDCGTSDTEGGWGGVGRIGGTLSPVVRLAAGTNTWPKSEGGTTFTASSFEFQAHWFPNAGDVFLYGGAGLGALGTDYDFDETGASFTAGAGYSINLGERKKVALVPEISWTVVTVEGTGHFFQASFGFFWN
jgi:hypothetical protein